MEGDEPARGGQVSGRDPYHRVVNLAVRGGRRSRAGRAACAVRVVEATPHSLIGEPVALATREQRA